MFNQFGYEWDAFDTYREAVDRSNRGAVKVLSALGLGCCAALILAAALGLWICCGKNRKPGQALKAGYLVAACFYLLAIYGSAKQQADALWIGVQMVLCAYFLDYAWRVILLQAVSYGGMMAAWMATAAPVVIWHPSDP